MQRRGGTGTTFTPLVRNFDDQDLQSESVQNKGIVVTDVVVHSIVCFFSSAFSFF